MTVPTTVLLLHLDCRVLFRGCLQEAQHRRERKESSEKWVIQASRVEDDNLNIVVSGDAKSPAGLRSPPQHSSRVLSRPAPVTRHRILQPPPSLKPSLDNKVFMRGTDELGLPSAHATKRWRRAIPSPQPPSSDNNRRGKSYAARTVGQDFSGFRNTWAGGENQRPPQSATMLGRADDRLDQPASSTQFQYFDQQQVTQGHIINESDNLEEGLGAMTFSKRLPSSLYSSSGDITPLMTTRLSPQPPRCEMPVRQAQQMRVPAVQKITAGADVDPYQQAPRPVLASPRSQALYPVGEALGLTTPDESRSPEEMCPSHECQQSRARSRSPPHLASETVMKSPTPGIGSPIFGDDTVNTLAVDVARALGDTDVGGVSGTGRVTSPEPCFHHISGNVPAIATSPGFVGRASSSDKNIHVAGACPTVNPRSDPHTGVLVNERYLDVKKDQGVTVVLVNDGLAGSSQERSETTKSEIVHNLASEGDKTVHAARESRGCPYTNGGMIMRDEGGQTPWEAVIRPDATSTLPTLVKPPRNA